MSIKYATVLGCLAVACAGNAREQWAAPPSPTTLETPAPSPPPASPAPAPSTQPSTLPASPAPSAPVVLVPLEPPKPPPGAVWPPPGGWTPPPCALESTAKVTRRGALFHVSALLRNVTTKALELDVPDRCPQGSAQFSGLPQGYDYYGACAAGACPSSQPSLHRSLAPGQSIELASIDIDPKQTSCNAPLAPGKYNLSFSLTTSLRVCGGAPGKIEVSAAQVLPAPPAPAKPQAPCPPGPACGIACPGGRYAHDANGCSVCGCEADPFGPAVKTRPGQW